MEKRVGIVIIIVLILIVAMALGWIFTLEDTESNIPDSDGDGYNDEIDAFPDNPGEWVDTDSDGVGDNQDVFPDDPNEFKDSDGDGFGSNTDLWDGGNAGIQIKIEQIFVYSHLDEADNDPDPYFIIKADIGGYGTWDYTWQSIVYDDGDVPPNEVKYNFDVWDDLKNITFVIEVWDHDQLTDDEVMDYSNSSGKYWDEHDLKIGPVISGNTIFPFSELYETDGSDDGNSGENDCSLKYWIQVIEIT